jgi:hypothetical protein
MNGSRADRRRQRRGAALRLRPVTDPARNWPEDFSQENGNYLCLCISCSEAFVGHKRRVVCRQCVTKLKPI